MGFKEVKINRENKKQILENCLNFKNDCLKQALLLGAHGDPLQKVKTSGRNTANFCKCFTVFSNCHQLLLKELSTSTVHFMFLYRIPITDDRF